MILIAQELTAALKAAIPEVSIGEPEEALEGNLTLLVEDFPTNEGTYLNAQPYLVQNAVTITARAKKSGGAANLLQAKQAALQLLLQADEVLNQQFLLTMEKQAECAAAADGESYLCRAHYTACVNSKTKEFSRRILKNG